MANVAKMMTATRGRGRWDWTDWASYGYLILGVLIMFGPVLWLAASSLKSQAGLAEYPPTLLPTEQTRVNVPGYASPLPLFTIDASGRTLAEVRRVGLQAQMVDPADPKTIIRVPVDGRA